MSLPFTRVASACQRIFRLRNSIFGQYSCVPGLDGRGYNAIEFDVPSRRLLPTERVPTMHRRVPLAVFLSLSLSAIVIAKGPAYTDPSKTDDDFAFQGEYASDKIGVQVIALGKGQFEAKIYSGGLPGKGWDGKKPSSVKGQKEGEAATFGDAKIEGDRWVSASGESVAKVHRKSPTLGKKPPTGAVVLFDGSTADKFKDGKLSDDGLLQQGCMSKQNFGSHQLHIEFRLPYQPEDRGQGRGNSGLYLQGRYEVQMLDSFGLEGKQNECGGVYSVSAPKLNMCLPPLSWQTYDVDYTAAKYDDNGKLTANPHMTVRHNGVVIHENLELPGNRNTTAAPLKAGPEPGPVYLQNHGNPVRYRNIWVVEKD